MIPVMSTPFEKSLTALNIYMDAYLCLSFRNKFGIIRNQDLSGCFIGDIDLLSL